MAEYWNHNVAHHGAVLDAVPADCRAALDIGYGDGLLVRKLAGHARQVTGLDRSPQVIERARRLTVVPRLGCVREELWHKFYRINSRIL